MCFLQEANGEVVLAVRWGWLMRDIADPSLLTHPAVQTRNPRRIYWQRDLCSDGQLHVSGELPSGIYWRTSYAAAVKVQGNRLV